MPNKALNLRLPESKVEELAAVALADGMHVSDAVREAIDRHIAARRADQDFGREREPGKGISPSPGH